MLFAVHVELSSVSMWWNLSSSDKHTKSSPCTATLTSLFHLWNGVAFVFASLEFSRLSTHQVHKVKIPHVRSILSSVLALDQSANFVVTIFLTIFRWKTDKDESLGCSLAMLSADVVVSQLQGFPFPRKTNRHQDRDKRLRSFIWWRCREKLTSK